ncbi:protein COFACTOR ASSEMBLY OF COMPLEX C SUBUNIT B CCB3, chloroplastic-like [Olea europaea var. sylvestris]|uniref:COFACTOR ASSEMBLY OF COMPLEX C SUBUNIT B CCB3, chloroplastic-like n=1 Tax=Olea europaea subsp. europaea TaxID=158383 RepID=A0A8S0QTX4_OLEEU|nr:protein COFACTOR ASSEMBLY OF COMPLEX C SUBUNIT B CCB3, chloroplastic-like [Olea europaea var. sylvestris]CAA2969190.1 COFACTOR ASSEMBLY OF COMPLEX C SUBUNIT B CCB3, chloroplastic-like [Olea europaea subsp. europaea]
MAGITATTGLGVSCPSKLTGIRSLSSPLSSTARIDSGPKNFNREFRGIKQHKVTAYCCLRVPVSYATIPSSSGHEILEISTSISHSATELTENLVLMDLDPATAKLAIGVLGPFLSAFGFLFILRIVMSWYPKLPVEKIPYVIAYAPTEPFLVQTRKVIPPLGGVDVTPVVWFGLISFLNEILVGPQGLLVLLSKQV